MLLGVETTSRSDEVLLLDGVDLAAADRLGHRYADELPGGEPRRPPLPAGWRAVAQDPFTQRNTPDLHAGPVRPPGVVGSRVRRQGSAAVEVVSEVPRLGFARTRARCSCSPGGCSTSRAGKLRPRRHTERPPQPASSSAETQSDSGVMESGLCDRARDDTESSVLPGGPDRLSDGVGSCPLATGGAGFVVGEVGEGEVSP